MRIGIQLEHFDPSRGGLETYVALFVRQLTGGSHEVHLFAKDFAQEPAGVRLHRIKPYSLETVWEASVKQKLDAILGVSKNLGAHVYQPHGGTYLASRRQNLAIIRNPWLRRVRGFVNRLLPKYLANASIERRQYQQENPRPHFVAVSRMVYRDIQHFYGVSPRQLHLIYNGVDVEQFMPARCAARREYSRAAFNLSPETTCFLLVAHNFRLKGVRELIEAAGRVRQVRRDFVVLVAGKGNPSKYYRLADRCGCKHEIRFLGPLADVEQVYAAADAYVHPTWYDPCSLTVLEALACGLPVITTRFNGASELMTDGREGFVIASPDDTAALSERMLRLFDASSRAQMSAAGRALAEQHPLQDNFRDMVAVLELASAENGRSKRLAA